METIHRAASAATALFGEHGEHGQHGQATTRTNAAGERSHEPLSGRMGNTKAGEPYDAGNLDEASQQRIAASRGDPTTTGTTGGYTSTTGTAGGYAPTTSTTGTAGGYAPTTSTTGTAGGYATTTSTTGTAGGYAPNNSTTGTAGGHAPTTSTTSTTGGFAPTSSSTGEDETRRGSDISPRSGPASGTIPIPSSVSRQAGGGSYSSARETAARAMGAAETPGSSSSAGYTGAGAGAAAGGAGLWSAGQRRDDVGQRDENGYSPSEEGYTGKGTEDVGKGTQKARFSDEAEQQGQKGRVSSGGGEADVADVTPSTTHAEGKKVRDISAVPGEREGAPLGRRSSLTAHLPGEPGGEGMRRLSGAGQGTGEQWVKSSGFKADGGDFDASAPGAGREADRLLMEKGIKRSGADEKKVTGQMDIRAPDANNNNSEGEKLGGLKDKLKSKLHKT